MFIVKSIDETIKLIKENFNNYSLRTKKVRVKDSLNYISAETIKSHENVPHFDRSIVDGYAVDFNSVKLASVTTPSILNYNGEVHMGTASKYTVNEQNTVYVPTGGHLPTGANSVVMIENTDKLLEEIIINKSVTMWENVLKMGTDIKVGTTLISKNRPITPLVIGALKAVGTKEIEVYEQLTVSLISTGDEIVENKDILEIGEIRDINSFTISNHLKNKNFIINNNEIISDDFEKYKNAVLKGFEDSDIVFSSGGSSVGDKDYTFDILKDIGAEILVHGVNIKPGKPTIIAEYNNKLFFGLPGQPTSAFFVLNTFIDVVRDTIFGINNIMPIPYFKAKLELNVHSTTGRRMYQLVKIKEGEKGELIAMPLFAKSGMINALKEADGYIIIDEYNEGYDTGTIVKVFRLGD